MWISGKHGRSDLQEIRGPLGFVGLCWTFQFKKNIWNEAPATVSSLPGQKGKTGNAILQNEPI
jgi:hypothetical protein